MNELKRVLIEGYQEEKIQTESYDEAWAQIYAARQNDLILQAEITGFEVISGRLCALVHVGNVRGIIPQEYSGTENPQQFKAMIGEPVAFKIVSYDRDGDTFVASRQAAIEHMAGLTWKRLEPDAVILGVVRRVERKSLVLDIGGVRVELPVQEFSHGWIDDLREVVRPGDHFRVKVVELDRENKKVSVSKKALEPSPWPECTKRYRSGGEYVGRVSGVVEYGVFVNLEPGVDALVPHMRFGRISRGDRVLIRIREVDVKKQHIRGRIVRKIS